ncbi:MULTISPECIES: diguanylate cyclase [Corallincola]|uniref:diguanylate cyclase n=2 Tax=Corallincola TaxID=1775176 RepID=A0A368N4D7_9GAMM|nr:MULTISPECIES: diguanylate cyclase [Corallincola]RCU45086.1 diguanylate cyclase [Corallincola holothuriorum]TAA46866.1 diguanylate cyclase [Corallincola spongiicola]
MERILVVEDSPMVLKIIRHLILQGLDVDVVTQTDLASCREQLDSDGEFFAAVVDLNLPDAPNGEVVELVLDRQIPTVVLTGSYDDERRERLLSMGVVDYVVKESRHSYDYVVKLLRRLQKNRHIKVLVADDSGTTRRFIKGLLQQHLYQVLEAKDGKEALKVLAQHPDVSILITDYAMPEMDGFELVKQVRTEKDKHELVIIGLSSTESGALSAKFIKNGANDFLRKPFFHEEFHCRLMHNLEEMELIQAIQDAANRDYLTQLYNRRYFFTTGGKHHEQAVAKGQQLALAMLDIDHFKQLNDNYGHEAGDEVLRQLASKMTQAFPRFICARMGGEEFCIMMPGLNNDQANQLLEGFRLMVAQQPFMYGDTELQVTFSAGVTNQLSSCLDNMYQGVDEYLYRAKEAGRNFVITDD